MKLFHCLLLASFVAASIPSGAAPIVFSATDLLHEVGARQRAYYTTSAVSVASLLGEPGGPHRWDFSHPGQPFESIQRMDVVAPSDAAHGINFPNAAYAEGLTNETTGARSWSYYRVATDQGRLYYGFYDAVANAECPLKVFDAPTVDLPDRLQFGQSWSRMVDFADCIDAGFIVLDLAVHFISQAQVDAHGTIVLPGIGEVPALRVNEVNTYEITDRTLGLPIPTQHFRNYYWLVPGIGKAVHVISEGSATVPPPNFTTAKTVLRVFEVRPWPAADLRILHQAGQALLNWRQETNTSGYGVESRRDFSTNSIWELLAEPTGNSWFETLITNERQRFFRVFVKP